MNRSNRVQRFKADAVIGVICWFEDVMQRRRTAMRRPPGAEEVAERASPDRRDKESACAPKRGQRRRI